MFSAVATPKLAFDAARWEATSEQLKLKELEAKSPRNAVPLSKGRCGVVPHITGHPHLSKIIQTMYPFKWAISMTTLSL